MNRLTREDKLRNLLAAEEADLPRQIEWLMYRRNKVRLGSILTGLAGYAHSKAIHAYFVERDINACKQHFYLASKLTLASVGQDGGASFQVGSDFLCAVLSDNSQVIDALAHIETPEFVRDRNNPLVGRFHVHMLQLAIRDERDALRAKIDKVAKHGRNPERTECAAGQDFFSLLLKRDKASLEHLIQTKHSRIKSADPVNENFLSFLATLETKLCWLKGIPVQIDSPLVPMALMPVMPLAHYDDVYEFLRPGWEPPPQGLLGRAVRWLGSGP